MSKLREAWQPGMRRTYDDLARRGGVVDLRDAIHLGHATEAVQRHYSTVSPVETTKKTG
jgi:hypothetical protein